MLLVRYFLMLFGSLLDHFDLGAGGFFFIVLLDRCRGGGCMAIMLAASNASDIGTGILVFGLPEVQQNRCSRKGTKKGAGEPTP